MGYCFVLISEMTMFWGYFLFILRYRLSFNVPFTHLRLFVSQFIKIQRFRFWQRLRHLCACFGSTDEVMCFNECWCRKGGRPTAKF